MTLPTKDEARRAAERIERLLVPGFQAISEQANYRDALALLEAYAAGELVARPKNACVECGCHTTEEYDYRVCGWCGRVQ